MKNTMYFSQRLGRNITIPENDATYVVICEVSGGVTGFRQGELKSKGEVRTFDTFDDAQAEAARLTKEMNGPYATCNFRYWASVR